MKISETTLGAIGDLAKQGISDVVAAKKAGYPQGAGTSALGALFSPSRIGSGVSVQDKMAENNFVKDFTSKAIQAINGAIESGYVDPKKAPENLSLAQAPSSLTKQEPEKAGKPSTGADSSQTPSASAPTEPLTFGGEKYTKGPNGWINSKGKPADANTAKILDQAAQQAGKQPPAQQAQTQQPPAQPSATKPRVRIDPKTGQYTPAANVKKSSVPQGGGRVKGAGLSQTPGAVKKRQARAAAKTAPASPAAAPRQTVAQKAQGYLQQQALKKKAAPGIVKESLLSENEYRKMNYIFESILETMIEAEPAPSPDQQENPSAISIPEFLIQQVIPDYFENIPIQKAEKQFQTLLQKIPATWEKGNSKAELQSIARLAYSLAKKVKKSDIEQKAQGAPDTSPAASSTKSAKGPETKGTDWGGRLGGLL